MYQYNKTYQTQYGSSTAYSLRYPSDPTNPGNPSSLPYPSNPSNPSNPTYPGYPTNPTYPGNTTYLSNPTYPSKLPNSSSPASTTKPTYPAYTASQIKPTYPTSPTNPMKPTYPTSPIKPTYPTNPVKPTYPTNPVTPTYPTTPGQPTYPGNANYLSKPTYPSTPPIPNQSTYPGKPTYRTNLNINPANPTYPKYTDVNQNVRVPFRNAPDPSTTQSCKFGERGSGLRQRGEPQDFQKIRAHCLRQGIVFEDPEFPADDSNIFYSRPPSRPFEWKRPHELVENPRLFVGGASRFDVQQGELGDCWLLAAVANLTLNQALFVRVVPDDQSFVEDYAGIFHFRFWQYGRWVDVVVDDRLPTFNGRLVFMHSTENNEFWSALLEKAYAKLHGSYEALKGGTTCEAMEDFTGGVTEMYELDKAPGCLFRILLKAYERSSLMGCSIEPDKNVIEAELPNGLIRGHAYSITRIKMVDIRTQRMSGKIPLIRIRNPWGNEAEWNGAWSDKSPEWQYIPDGEKQELGLTFESDGEFWMSFQDFLKNFNRLEVCNLDPDALDEDLKGTGKKWQSNVFEGSWLRGVTAGGCRNFLNTFHNNPQYRIELEDPDDDDDDDDEDDKGKCTVIIGLMQKNRRTMRKMGVECLTIGFGVYKLENESILPKPLDMNFFKFNTSVARAPTFINLREVCARFKLPPGSYCIVPSTFEPNEEGDFVLRVFSEKKSDMKENDEDVSLDKPDESIRCLPDSDAKEAMRAVFKRISGDDMEVDPHELKEVLDLALKKEFQFDGFSEDVCRSMVAMMDVDRSGKLGFEEFIELWSNILTWKNVFKAFDKDNSHHLTTFELRTALHSAGYRLNWHILKALVLRYGEKNSTMAFDNFILCAVKLKSMIETFKDKDPGGKNVAMFTLEEWIEKTMYS